MNEVTVKGVQYRSGILDTICLCIRKKFHVYKRTISLNIALVNSNCSILNRGKEKYLCTVRKVNMSMGLCTALHSYFGIRETRESGGV
jgi:hypothetical protein